MIYFDSLFKQPLYYLVLVVSVLGLVACSDSTQPASSNTAKPARIQANADQTRIALVMKTLTNPFFIEMERGARRAEQDLGITLVVKTAAQETSIQQQIGIVEELISDAVDAIVIAPGDSIELIPVLKKAQDSGITVINIDNQLDPEYSRQVGLRNVPFISVDNEQAAYESVQALTRLIDAPTEVAIIEGIREAKNADDRKNGAVRAFEEHPNTTIVAMHTAHWKIDEGYEVTRQILEDHPTIGALFCANDMMALGAIKYLQSIQRSDVLIAAYDALDEAIQAIRDGSLQVTVDQQPAQQGYQGVVFAHRALGGEQLPLVTLVSTRIITKESL